MNLILRKLLFATSFVVTAICAVAESKDEAGAPLRPVTSAYTFEIGGSRVCDTYLSPLAYRGWSVALGYERMQAMQFNPENFVMQLSGRAEFQRGLNPAHTNAMIGFEVKIGWGMMKRFYNCLPGMTFAVGGSTEISAGAFSKSTVGNNPVSAKAAWTINLTGYAAWNVKIGRLPVTLRYQPQLPLLGVFFSPQYDELYYEIYLGNHQSLAKFANPVSRFAMDNYLTFDMHFGATVVRLGYRGTILSSKANNLVTNSYTNNFVIGIAGEWMSLNPYKPRMKKDTEIISAIY